MFACPVFDPGADCLEFERCVLTKALKPEFPGGKVWAAARGVDIPLQPGKHTSLWPRARPEN